MSAASPSPFHNTTSPEEARESESPSTRPHSAFRREEKESELDALYDLDSSFQAALPSSNDSPPPAIGGAKPDNIAGYTGTTVDDEKEEASAAATTKTPESRSPPIPFRILIVNAHTVFCIEDNGDIYEVTDPPTTHTTDKNIIPTVNEDGTISIEEGMTSYQFNPSTDELIINGTPWSPDTGNLSRRIFIYPTPPAPTSATAVRDLTAAFDEANSAPTP